MRKTTIIERVYSMLDDNNFEVKLFDKIITASDRVMYGCIQLYGKDSEHPPLFIFEGIDELHVMTDFKWKTSFSSENIREMLFQLGLWLGRNGY